MKDSQTSFMDSYSYCPTTAVCQFNEIDYINKWCELQWKTGWMIDIMGDCKATRNTECLNFVSDPEKYGQYFNETQYLSEGEYCTINVDATNGVARVAFTDVDSLGVLYNGYEIGTQITVPEGESQEITIFNGQEASYGTLAFQLSFSKASSLAASSFMAILVGFLTYKI